MGTSFAQAKAVEMQEQSQQRGHPSSAYQRDLHTERESLLVKKTTATTTSSQIIFSTEYSPLVGRVKNIILKHRNFLQSDPSLNNISASPDRV